MQRANKIIVKNSVQFYAEAQKDRNKVFHNQGNYKVFVIKLCEQVKEMILRENRDEMKRHLRTQETNVETCDASYIQAWILEALDMRKRVEVGKGNDIRGCFAVIP